MKLGLHELTVTDLSGDRAEEQTHLFRTPEAALGYAAHMGTLGGYVSYRLDGKPAYPSDGSSMLAQQPVGRVVNGRVRLQLTT